MTSMIILMEFQSLSFTIEVHCTRMVYLMAFGARLLRGEVALIGYKLLHYVNILIPKISKMILYG